jgi:RNA polymerase sigma-70 factor (ECF subfamily)
MEEGPGLEQARVARFEAVRERYAERIYRFCFRLSGNAADAEDLTQDVFVSAYQNLDQFHGQSALSSWLLRIAIYRWQRIKETRGPETVSLEPELGATIACADVAPTQVERISLERALSSLPDILREAFILVKAEGLTYREAAIALGAPQGTVQWRVSEASARMRRLLADAPEEPCSANPERRRRPVIEIRVTPGRQVADEV